MMFFALLIASCLALSLGQTTNCINAYNATLGDSPSDDGTCRDNLVSLFFSSLSPDSTEAIAICQEGQDCNSRLENIASVCGDTVSYSTNSLFVRVAIATTESFLKRYSLNHVSVPLCVIYIVTSVYVLRR